MPNDYSVVSRLASSWQEPYGFKSEMDDTVEKPEVRNAINVDEGSVAASYGRYASQLGRNLFSEYRSGSFGSGFVSHDGTPFAWDAAALRWRPVESSL